MKTLKVSDKVSIARKFGKDDKANRIEKLQELFDSLNASKETPQEKRLQQVIDDTPEGELKDNLRASLKAMKESKPNATTPEDVWESLSAEERKEILIAGASKLLNSRSHAAIISFGFSNASEALEWYEKYQNQ